MNDIISAISRKFHEFSQGVAQSINESDWKAVARKLALAGIVTCGIVVVLLMLFALLATIFGAFLGKLLGVPMLFFILALSYKANRQNAKTARDDISNRASLEAWAESVYDCVRDAMFLVLRAMSDYTVIIRPTSPGGVELPNGISIRDGYAVFSFFARVSADVDVPQLKRELTRTLGQMLRAHELKGLASDLVLINGSYYCPLQILDVIDFGDSINISVVFSTEKTVEIVHARKMLHLEKKEPRTAPRDTLYDDEI